MEWTKVALVHYAFSFLVWIFDQDENQKSDWWFKKKCGAEAILQKIDSPKEPVVTKNFYSGYIKISSH